MHIVKSIFVLLFALLWHSAIAQIPVFEWVNPLLDPSTADVIDVTTDSSENVIITGFFMGTQDFDPGPADYWMTTNGVQDIFVAKYDVNGNFLWAHSFGDINEDEGQRLFVDTLDNIYVYGSFEGLVDFDPSANDSNLLASGEYNDFLLKLDPVGNFIWAHAMPNPTGSVDNFARYNYHPSVGIILTGNTSSQSIDYDPGPGTYIESATGLQGSAYVLTLDLDANLQWFERFEQSGTGNINPTGVVANNQGEIFITGRYVDSVDFDPGVSNFYITENSSFGQGCVIKLDNSGNFIWASGLDGDQISSPFDINIDNNDNVRVIGTFEGITDFNPGTNVFNLNSPNNERDYFVLGLTNTGGFDWAFSYPDPADAIIPAGIDVDNQNNVVVACWHNTDIDVDPGPGVTTVPNASNILIASYAQNGDFNWVKSVGGTDLDRANAIHIAPSGNIYTVGIFDDTVNFNPGTTTDIHGSILGNDGFLLKYSMCTQSTPIPDVTSLSDVTSECVVDTISSPQATEFCTGAIFGTPDVTFPITAQGTTTVTWTYDAGNGFVATQTQNVIINDATAPAPDLASLADVDSECSITSLNAPTATDNCAGIVTVTNDATFPITSSTVVTWTYDDGNGNTSTQIQNVSITPIDNGISVIDGITLTADASGYQYQWIDCDNGNAPINGATNQTYVASSNGNYAVEVSNGSCSVISICLTIDEVGLSESIATSLVDIYPNPSEGSFTISSSQKIDLQFLQIKNTLGQSVPFQREIKNGKTIIILKEQPGIYYLSFDGTVIYPLVKL